MSTLKSKFISAPVNGATVEPLVLQTNNIDRITVAADGTVTSAAGFTDSGNRLRPLVSGTSKTATGTAVDFTDIPSWAKRITVMFSGVSTSGTSNYLIQIGDSGGIENTGYLSQANTFNSSPSTTASTAGFILLNVVAAANAYNGAVPICNLSGNNWVISGVLVASTAASGVSLFGGAKTLSDTLTQVRITTVNGTDTFDAGTINILYE